MNKIYKLIILSVFGFSSISAQTLINHFNFGGTNSDGLIDLATDSVNNQYITGFYTGAIDLDPGPGVALTYSFGGRNIFVSKFDSSGNFIWGFGIGSSADDEGSHICVDHSGNVIVTGRFSASMDFNPGSGSSVLISNGIRDMFIAKYSSTGNFLWGYQGGGINYDDTEDVTVDQFDNIYVAGSFISSAEFNGSGGSILLSGKGSDDPYLLKYNSGGLLMWAKTLGSSGIDDISSIVVDDFGHLYAAGYFSGLTDFDMGPGVYNVIPNGSADAFIARYNTNADFEWVTSVGGQGFDLVMDFDVVNDKIFSTGGFHNTVDFDPGITSNNKVSLGGYDVFIWELDTVGNYINAVSSGSMGDDLGRCIVKDYQGGYLMAADFNGNFLVNGISNAISLSTNGGVDLALTGYSNSLDLNWAFNIGGAGNEEFRSAFSHPNDEFSIYGVFSNSIDLSPDHLHPYIVNSNGGQDAFMAKYSYPVSVGISEYSEENVNVFPNPTSGFAHVKSDVKVNLASLYSPDGKLIMEYRIDEKEFTIPFYQLIPGCYLIKLKSDSGIAFKKVMKF